MRYLWLFLLCGFSMSDAAQHTTADRLKHLNLENNVADSGYDPEAYFKQGKALKGDSKISWTHLGVTYHFASESNKNLFKANPSAYEPQYGGWCAFAMGDYGKKVEVNTETFKIVDGKLYLFYNAYFNNTLKSWNKNEKQLKEQADQNWNQFLNQ